MNPKKREEEEEEKAAGFLSEHWVNAEKEREVTAAIEEKWDKVRFFNKQSQKICNMVERERWEREKEVKSLELGIWGWQR